MQWHFAVLKDVHLEPAKRRSGGQELVELLYARLPHLKTTLRLDRG